MKRTRDIVLAMVCLGITAPLQAAPLITGSSRADFNWLHKAPEIAFAPEDGATNVEWWVDVVARDDIWDAGVRARVHNSNKIPEDENFTELDRRHIGLTLGNVDVRAGHFYSTFGNGIILRSLEQRFVALNRTDRAFNLDRNLDGVRVRGRHQYGEAQILAARPKRVGLSVSGGAQEELTEDNLYAGDVELTPVPWGAVALGFVRADLASQNGLYEGRAEMDLLSLRGTGRHQGWEAQFEYAEARPTGDLVDVERMRRGYANYGLLTGSLFDVGLSAEWKRYRHFDNFLYTQPPTGVYTHDSVLLNRSTHVVLLENEKGFQVGGQYSPDFETEFVFNVASADRADYDPRFRYREVYGSVRRDLADTWTARVDGSWLRDRTKFKENQYTTVMELEHFLTPVFSVVGDVELQWVEGRVFNYGHQLVQLAVARAGRWTASGVLEHGDSPLESRDWWWFATVDLRLSESHDMSVGYGTRPAGVVCSGGYCFQAPEFDGFEFRILSRFQ